MTFTNLGTSKLTDIRIGGGRQLAPGMTLHEFPAISSLIPAGDSGAGCAASTSSVTLGINFNDTTQTAKFDIVVNEESGGNRCHKVSIAAPTGELLRPVALPETVFKAEQRKLRGMNETSSRFEVPSVNTDEKSLKKKIYEVVNVTQGSLLGAI